MADSKHSTIDPKLLHELIPPGFKDAQGLAGYLQEHPDIEKQLPYSLSEVWDQYSGQNATPTATEPIANPKENSTHQKKHHEEHEEEHHEVDVSEVSLSDALMSNEHYRNIIENTVDDWNKANPNQKITQVFVTDEDGKKIINPEITGKGDAAGKIQDIEKRATDTFTMAYGTRALKSAQIAEKNKSYKKAVDDPAFKRLQRDIKLGTKEENAYDDFVKAYPGKARSYLSFGKFPLGSKERSALKAALKRREEALKKEQKDKEEKAEKERKDKEKQQKDWDKAYYKANGRFPGKVTTEHGGVTAFNASVAEKLNESIEKEILADQKKGVGYTRDVYEKRLGEKVRKEQLDELFRKEPGRAQYLMRFDPKMRDEYKAWQKEQEAKAKQRASERIDPDARYANAKDDPRVRKLDGDIRDATETEYQRRLEESRKGKGRWIRGIWYPDPKAGYQAPDKQAIESDVRKKRLLDFATANPNLVRDYAKNDPEFASAYKAYQEQQRQREQARRLGEKRGILPGQRGSNESEGLTLGERMTSPTSLVEPHVQSTSTPANRPQPMSTSAPHETPAPPTKPMGFMDRLRRRSSPPPEPKQESDSSSEKPRIRSPRQVVRDRAKSTAGKAGKAIDKRLGGAGSKAKNKLNNLKNKVPGGGKIPTSPEDAAKKLAKKLAEEAAKRGVMMPQVWGLAAAIAIIFVILVLILAVSYVIFGEPEDEEMPTLTPTPSPTLFPTLPPGQLTITKTGPQTPNEDGTITYTITVGGITDGAIVTDRLTGKASYVNATPEAEATAITTDKDNNVKTVIWTLSPDNGQSQTITLTVKSTEKDQIIYNVAEVERTAQSAPPPQSTDKTTKDTPTIPNTPPDLSTNDFTKLMEGQGRNTTILGSEDEFVETVFRNVSGQRNLSNRTIYEGLVREIYQRATRDNINPLIPLVMWGVESSYAIDGHEYNCPRGETSGFDQQLDCTVNTLNTWMKDFESKYDGKNPVPYQNDSCKFTDPFIYAYEAFTPVCWTSDANDNARTNFVILFKEFMGEN